MGRDAVTDTQGDPGGVLAQASGTGVTRRSAVWLVAVFVAIVLAALMSLVRLPYAVVQPGPARNILGNTPKGKPFISVDGKATYPTTGALSFTTIHVSGGPSRPVNGWRFLIGHLDPASRVVPEEELFPKGVTSKQVETESAAQMTESQQEAIAVALRGLGQTVPEIVTIGDFTDGSPADGVLRQGDVLISVDGKAATSTDAVRGAILAHKPGENVAFTVRRGGAEQVLNVRTTSSEGRTVVGILLRAAFDFPTKVSINAGEVGGPSAGLMFALAVYDKLTPGAITGGAKIAGTGTIDSAGKVGPIGSIQQKLVGAKRAGATWFLAPAANCKQVVGNIPDGLKVTKVATFTEAKDAVEAIAANQTASLPQCQT